MLIKRLATILLIIVFAIEAANARDIDSTAVATRDCCEAIAGVPLLALGVGLHLADNGYHSRIDDGDTIAHKSTLDNIAQYSPGALMLALKAAGVESRSSWGRMLTADAFAAAIYLGATESVKRIANTRRPDQTDCRSFPSGHSAMAFLCATMLHKEYGGVSPWYSLGGYTAATATAMARVLNNRHWQEDVLTGAAIGVISTHLGYLISDLIFKRRGLTIFDTSLDEERNPSYLGVSMGATFSLNDISAGGVKIGNRRGLRTSIAGAYYISRHFGIGGNVSVNAFNLYNANDPTPQPSRKSLANWGGGIGPDFTWQLLPQLNLGARAHLNYSRYPTTTIASLGTLGGTGGIGTNIDLSLAIMPNETFSMRIDTGYLLAPSPVKGGDNAQFITLAFSGAINF